MACSSCSTGKGDSPSGCKNNGTCGTDGCNKLNIYNWLSDMALPTGQEPFPIIEVRFKGSRKEFFHNKDHFRLKEGDVIAVEASPGHDLGTVSMTGELVRFQLTKKKQALEPERYKLVYRNARESDIEKWNAVREREHETMIKARQIAIALKLNMKLSDVEYQADGKKAIFYYTADGRVDFRELIKKLADNFKVRIEMKQIGIRQEASRLGGIGSCGRELCCSTWLTDFKAVSTSAARYQNLSLNPVKLAGQCGKLKCCLNYELDTYLDAISDFPNTKKELLTKKGKAKHMKTDIFKRMMWYYYVFTPDPDKKDSAPINNTWVPISVDRVKEIIELNKEGNQPDELVDMASYIETETVDYADVVGQQSLGILKKKKKRPNKNRKKTPSNRNKGGNANRQGGNTNKQGGNTNKQGGNTGNKSGGGNKNSNRNRNRNRNKNNNQGKPKQGPNKPQKN
ncbi:MAG: hypothetical protein HKO56_09415 [Bacteroidia bacterium]|nr:hypothetical protein [Bacteroidia bacterium]NNC86488.1 hypothetical protein [Bacteroidia bacterium]NNM16865.1 hypothetical protein [Bacteroidia bacterium]